MKTARKEAEDKVNAAAKSCAEVQSSWVAAAQSLEGTVGTNGGGIYRDSFQLQGKLIGARQHINAALKTLDQIDWPTNADYDQI